MHANAGRSARAQRGAGPVAVKMVAPSAMRRLRATTAHVARRQESAAAPSEAGGSLLPLRVGADFHPPPPELQRVRNALAAAVGAQDFRLASSLQDLLHVAEPKPPLTLDACCPESPDECLAFFLREGFVCVRNLFDSQQMKRMQAHWRRAQAPTQTLWDEAKLVAGNFIGEDFKPQPRFAHFPHGRLWFDLPLQDFFGAGDPMLDLIDPPRLLSVLEKVVGSDVRLLTVQPRTVPPETNQGYTGWHRDGIEPPTNDSHPHCRRVKVFVNMFDTAEDQGCTSVGPIFPSIFSCSAAARKCDC